MKYIKHNLKEISLKIKANKYIFLFIDYDGTLVGFKDDPDQAVPPDRIKELLLKLSSNENLIITIVSGRTVSNLLEFFKDIDTGRLNWIGVHGAQYKYRGSSIELSPEAKKAVPMIKKLKSKLINMAGNIPCIFIEDKKISIALHYRKCGKKELSKIPGFTDMIEDFVADKPLDYLDMKKVIEVKPKNINKGSSLKIIKSKYKNLAPSINICIGDDITDKYLFDSNNEGINIKVGEDRIRGLETEYYLKNAGEVYSFLNSSIFIWERGAQTLNKQQS
jgi:trehalose 6-phosphate synthase/phosphatase